MKRAEPQSLGGAEPPLAADVRRALADAPAAAAAWEGLTPIARRDFAAWIESAKQAATRRRRIERACENLAAGKRRPCCYAVVPLDLYRGVNGSARSKAAWKRLTADQKRDLVDWVGAACGKQERQRRIGEMCARLGK